jgi:hypothetical protein
MVALLGRRVNRRASGRAESCAGLGPPRRPAERGVGGDRAALSADSKPPLGRVHVASTRVELRGRGRSLQGAPHHEMVASELGVSVLDGTAAPSARTLFARRRSTTTTQAASS